MRYDNFVIKPLAAGGLTSVSGALITVCTSAGTGTPCTPKVTNIYSDEALTTPIVGTGGAGTTNSDANGNFGFYAAPGSYVITVTGSGITSYTIKVVLPVGNSTGSSGTQTFTGIFQPKNLDNIKYVDVTNSQGWGGATVGDWLNSAIASLGQPGSVVLSPGNYAITATTVTVPAYVTLRMDAAFYSSSACPNFTMSGSGPAIIGTGRGATTIFNSCTSANGAINILAATTSPLVRDLTIQGQPGSFDAITLQDNQHFATFEDLVIKPTSSGKCMNQVSGATGTVFTKIHQVWCIGSGSPGFSFDSTGGGGNWEEFSNSYVSGGSGIGFLVANGSATFIRTSADSSVTGYQFGTATSVARISMENSDSESDTTGINIVGAGDYTIKHHNCGTISGTCIVVNAAGANTTIIDPASQGTGGASDITYSAASTGTHILIGGSGLGKLVTPTAPAFITQVAADVVANGGRVSAGGAPAVGSIAGDMTAKRSTTTGIMYLGSDGNVGLFRAGSTDTRLLGSSLSILGAPNGATSSINIGWDSTTGTGLYSNSGATASAYSGAWNCTNVTPVTVNANVSTDQNLMSCTIPAGTLNRVGRTLRVKVAGVYSTPAASVSQMTVKVKICSVSGCASGNVLTALSIQSTALGSVQITNDNFSLRGELITQTAGATLAEEAHGEYLIDLATLATAADNVFGDGNTATQTGTPSAIDSTAQNFAQVTFAFSTANASNSATERQFILETVN